MTIYITVSGHRLEHPDLTGAAAKFFERVTRMLRDEDASEADMIALVYSDENPILDTKTFPGRAMVTKEVFADPLYHVLTDLIFRKRIQEKALDLDDLEKPYILTVAQAAEQLGIHESAVRQAIAARRLGSWVRNGQHFLSQDTIDAFAAAMEHRGPRKSTEPVRGVELEVKLVPEPGIGLKIACDGSRLRSEFINDRLVGRFINAGWSRVYVMTTRHLVEKKSVRFFELAPSHDEDAEGIVIGESFVRGKFRILRKVNNTKDAVEAWREATINKLPATEVFDSTSPKDADELRRAHRG